MAAPDHWPGLTLLAATVMLEAEAEPEDGQLAVAFNPCNRARLTGDELHTVILGRNARAGDKYEPYSCWNLDYAQAARNRLSKMPDVQWQYFYKLATAAYWQFLPDPSNGADHYLNVELTKKIRGGTLPNWYDDSKIVAIHGLHTFLKLW